MPKLATDLIGATGRTTTRAASDWILCLGAANYTLGPAFTYASLPPALQNAAAAAAAATGLPLSHYAAAAQEARMQ